MAKENSSLDFKLKKNRWNKKWSFTRNKYNELMTEKHKNVCRALNYFEHFVFVSAVSGCVSVSAFASLARVPVSIVSSAVGLEKN